MSRFYMEAREAGSHNKFRRMYARKRGGYVWAGRWGGILVKTGRATRAIDADRRKDFIEWAQARGLQPRVTKVASFPNKTHYSKNFTREELDCKCGCSTPASIQANLARMAETMLEPLRAKLRIKLNILSGYRCPDYNRKVGGASSSQHMQGKAADFNMPSVHAQGITKREFDQALASIEAVNGIGLYPAGGRHGDIRNPPRATWTAF